MTRPETPGVPARGSGLRIALVKLSSLGDVVHALPAAHALRACLPECELTWIVERREAAMRMAVNVLVYALTH